MSYRVEHIRYTLECDCCGKVEKHDRTASEELADDPLKAFLQHWQTVHLGSSALLCCPECVENVKAVLCKREREAVAAEKAKIAACEHTYVQRGFVAFCSKCNSPQRP